MITTTTTTGLRSMSLFGKANPYVKIHYNSFHSKTKPQWGKNEVCYCCYCFGVVVLFLLFIFLVV